MADPYTIGLAVAGWLATTWLAYRWGLHSQKLQREHSAKSAVDGRKREFLAFMQAWKIEVDRRYLEVGGFARDTSAFSDSVSEFRAAAEMIRGDFTIERRKRFDELVAAVPRCRPHKTAQILKAIDDVIAHIEVA